MSDCKLPCTHRLPRGVLVTDILSGEDGPHPDGVPEFTLARWLETLPTSETQGEHDQV